ncbi:formylglycine-generating enzyme family protein, partial [Candidatus Saccharibacteria bacterium]|nr:formylglycine-generating enzyme family protein [Candidatus Saccharibacteria bacterium]
MGENTNASYSDGAGLSNVSGAARIVKRTALATLATAAFALFAGGIADSFRPINAQDVQINATLGTGFVSITDGACSVANTSDQPDYNATNHVLDISVLPGGVASNCLGITASTSNTMGYTLTIDGPDSGALTLAGQTIDPTSGSLTVPAEFTATTNGSTWGFAIPRGQINGFNFGFDLAYDIVGSGNADASLVGAYAPVPVSATPFTTTSAPATNGYDIFFGVSAGTNAATGTYTGVVTISGVGNAAPMVDCANIATGFGSGCTDQNITVRMPGQTTAGGAYTPSTGGLVPVVIHDNDNNPNTPPQVIVKANTDADWYDYAQKQWANAVTFATPANRSLASGTILSQSQLDDILGYWVYVPRYEYRLINTGFDGVSTCGPTNPQFCPQAFEIRFVNTTVATKVGSAIGDWHSHPGFRADLNGNGSFNDANEQVAGLWVAKYESSASARPGSGTGSGGTNPTINPSGVVTTPGTATLDCTDNVANNCDVSNIVTTFLPNRPSWTRITLNSIFLNTQRVQDDHGLATSLAPASTTGMANGWNNFSWGAAAYLSQSLYGVCTNRFCTYDGTQSFQQSSANHQKVYNNGYYLASGLPRYQTGCGPILAGSDGFDATCNAWFSAIGQTASTTGNLSGIYDMAGGVWEYTFSAYGPLDQECITVGSSGLAAGAWASDGAAGTGGCPAGAQPVGFYYRKFGGGLVYSLTQLGANDRPSIANGALA